MRFIFKTDYEDDIRLLPHSGYIWTYGTLLVLLAIAPFVFSSYIMSQLVFVCIYATVGVGLLILSGFTGQASLGHAAFLAIGAYTAGFLILTIIGTLNLLRSPTGRAFIAIRDSETAARSMGVNVALYKVKSFAISAAITGFAGVLFAHKLTFISPEMFTLQLSIEFIIVILIGGTFSLHGAVLGAIFLVMIDPFLTYLKDDMPGIISGIAATFGASKATASNIQSNVAAFASANGLKGAIYGVIIMVFVLFEPLGLYGRWLKIKLFFQLFPLYKRATFKRQKIYVKSERNR